MKKLATLLVALGGLAGTGASAGLQWFAIPVGTIGPTNTIEPTLQLAEPWATPIYQMAALAVAILVLVLWWLGKHTSRFLLVALSGWCAAILIFPYCVLVCDPPIAGNAAWLEAEHRNLIWSGGDVNNSLEYRIVGAFDKLHLTDFADEVNAAPIGDWQLSEMSLARLPELFERLGYANRFFQFIRLGWAAALIGCGLLMVWTCAAGEKLDLTGGGWAFVMTGSLLLLFSLLAWGRSFAASSCLAVAAEHTARGEYDRALMMLQRAAAILPVLQEDSFFIRQTGLLEDALGLDTPHARLYRANVFARQGRQQRAGLVYEQLIRDVPPLSPVSREACRAILRATIDHLNSARSNEAARRFAMVLEIEPCNLKANYCLQLAYLRCQRYGAISPLVARMDAIYDYFQIPNKQAVQYAAHHNSAAAEYFRGDPSAAISEARRVLN